MYFVRMNVQLEYENRDERLTVADGVHAHSAIMHTLSNMNPEAGRKLHDIARHKPMSIAILNGTDHDARLQLTFMADEGLEYVNLLMNGFSARSHLQIGETICKIAGVDLGNSKLAAISTWADLLSGPHGYYLEFRFRTPTAISKTDNDGKRFFSLFPVPLDVFSGLARRWESLHGPSLPGDLQDFIHKGGCVVTKHRLRTTSFHTSRRTQIGFIGSVTYTFLEKIPSYVAAINALARLAAFTGIGYQTARGMGAVNIRISR